MVKFSVFFLTLLTVLYFLLLGNTGFALVSSDSPVAKTIGASLFVLPVIGLWGVIVELRFGFKTERLAKQLEAEGAWPVLATEALPSGRPVKASALELFEGFKKAVDEDPTNWKAWFNLGLSYDACSDRKRARQALRKAIALHDQTAVK